MREEELCRGEGYILEADYSHVPDSYEADWTDAADFASSPYNGTAADLKSVQTAELTAEQVQNIIASFSNKLMSLDAAKSALMPASQMLPFTKLIPARPANTPPPPAPPVKAEPPPKTCRLRIITLPED